MAQVTCAYCGKTVAQSNRGQVTCGSDECKKRRKAEYKLKWKAKPEQRVKRRSAESQARARERNREWCKEHRGVGGSNPWLLGAPPFADYLPGGACLLEIPRFRQVPVDKVSQLHGMVTALINDGHPTNASAENGFTLIPWPGGIGWAVYSPHPALAAAPRVRYAVLGGHRLSVRLGPYARIKTPPAGKRGHQHIRVSAMTPVVISSFGHSKVCRRPEADNIVSTLVCTLAPRLGVSVSKEDVPMVLVESNTEPGEMQVGGKWGWLHGWVGSVTVETNAIGRWLLECAGRGLGLGGRTALGAGRVRVEV